MGICAGVRAWLDKPENEFLRRELRWTVRWLLGPWGILWGLAFVAATYFFASPSGNKAHQWIVYPDGPGNAPSPLSYAIGAIPWIYLYSSAILWGVFLWVLSQRALFWLTEPRLSELLISPIGRKELWPALILAPVLICVAYMGVYEATSSIARWALPLSWLPEPVALYDASTLASSMGRGLLHFFLNSILLAGLTSFAIWFSLFRPKAIVIFVCISMGFHVLNIICVFLWRIVTVYLTTYSLSENRGAE